MTLIVSLIFAALALMTVALQKTYTHLPVKELKRRARIGDNVAGALYRASAYGLSLQVLLWVLIGLFSAGFFVMLTRAVPAWLALLGSVALIWIGFVWLPKTRVNKVTLSLAKGVTPAIAMALRYVHPVVVRVKHALRGVHMAPTPTGLYEKEDLVELLQRQQKQADNRMSREELDMAVHSLSFGDKLVRDIMTPRRMIKAVKLNDSVGPVLLDELHASGHSRFPVFQDKPDNIVGMLFLRSVVGAKAGGSVSGVMKKEVYYIHEEQNLYLALQAFLKTHHHLFLVVNSFEELVGLLTIEDVIEQIIGKPIVDEFDKYDDLRAVAASLASKEHQEH